MADLRTEVARALSVAGAARAGDHALECADVAIAVALDALKEPSEGMLCSVVTEPTHLYGVDGRDAEYERDMKNAVAVERLVKRQDWQAMLAAFREEQGV